MAWSTEIMDPLPSAPSTTTSAVPSAATSRLRAGNRNGSASTPGAYSVTTAPAAAMRSTSCALPLG